MDRAGASLVDAAAAHRTVIHYGRTFTDIQSAHVSVNTAAGRHGHIRGLCICCPVTCNIHIFQAYSAVIDVNATAPFSGAVVTYLNRIIFLSDNIQCAAADIDAAAIILRRIFYDLSACDLSRTSLHKDRTVISRVFFNHTAQHLEPAGTISH